MKRPLLPLLVICACTAIGVLICLLAEPHARAAEDEDHGPAVQRYVPDERPRPAPPRPRPKDRQRTVYADRIVLEGPDCRIVLDATGRQPGIVLEHTRSKERVLLYFSPQGRAVLGITTPARKELVAGLFASRDTGYVQLADRWGMHVLSGAELSKATGRTGRIGAKKPE